MHEELGTAWGKLSAGARAESVRVTSDSDAIDLLPDHEASVEEKQIEIAKLIQDELSWDATILQSQDQLASLSKEALKEYKEGKTSDESW